MMRRKKLEELEREKILKLSQEELFLEGGKEVLDYLKDVRKFDDNILKKFSIGYVPDGVKNRFGNPHEFSGRMVIPIFNQYGDLVAYSSRDWRKDAKYPFWHESYQKSLYVYGLYLAKRYIIENKKAILVEGEFDVMKLHQVGVLCAVGICGSAPQLSQISLLRRYCKEIFLVFDSDTAGEQAANRIKKSEIFKYFHVIYDTEIIPVKLPGKLDPDDFIKQYGCKDFIGILQKSKKEYMDNKK